MEYFVVHHIPGRLRIRIPVLRDAELAALLTNWIGEWEGVRGLRSNVACHSLVIEYDRNGPSFRERLDRCLRRVTVPELRRLPSAPSTAVTPRTAETSKANFRLASASLALSLIGGPAGFALNLPLLVWNSIPIWRRALKVLRHEHRLNVDFLDALSLTISLALGQTFTTAFMVWLIDLGDLIRDRTAAKSRRAIAGLLDYQGRNAWVLKDGEVVEVPVASLQVGDHVVIPPGGLIPVDGEIVEGVAAVDQKTITGESLPVVRRRGDRVYAATVVREGQFTMEAQRVGDQTTAAQIVHLIEEAPAGETRIQNYAEKFADRLVSPWLAMSLGIYAATADVNRLLSMTIIDYGTGIRVAAPTTVLAAMTAAARQGIVIKGGSHLEKLARVDTVVFDKTGTLTRGEPEVQEVISYDEQQFPPPKLISLAASAEARLKHPVAAAILAKAREWQVEYPEREAVHYELGKGMSAQVNGYFVHLGSGRFLREQSIQTGAAERDVRRLDEQGSSTLLLAVDGELAGLIAYADRIRPESQAMLSALRGRGIKRTVMLTGDNPVVARVVARQLGIDTVYADTLPSDKARIVQQLQHEGHVVAMVGDGINDSPALSHAEVGIAMKNGADVARETADVVLMEDSLWKVLHAIEISQDAIRLVHQNYAIIAGLNTLAFALSLPSGLLNPGITAALSNGAAIVASVNAMRPLW